MADYRNPIVFRYKGVVAPVAPASANAYTIPRFTFTEIKCLGGDIDIHFYSKGYSTNSHGTPSYVSANELFPEQMPATPFRLYASEVWSRHSLAGDWTPDIKIDTAISGNYDILCEYESGM